MKLNAVKLIEIIKELDADVGHDGVVRSGIEIGNLDGKILFIDLYDVEEAELCQKAVNEKYDCVSHR